MKGGGLWGGATIVSGRVQKVLETGSARAQAFARRQAARLVSARDAVFESRWAAALARSPQGGLVGSVTLHAVVILAFLIHWPSHSSGDLQSFVPVELVTIGDETNIAQMVRQQLALPEKDVNAAPAAPSAAPEATPTFEMKLFPQKPSEAGPKQSTQQGEAKTAAAQPSSAPRKALVGDYDIKGKGDAMTMTAIDALRNQIARCWHPPANATLVVDLSLSRDGSIARPPLPRAGQPGQHEAEEALRYAIYTCAPYVLPAERYESWRDVTLTFDPSMLRKQ